MVTLPVTLNFNEELSVLDLYTGVDVPTPDFGEPIEIFNKKEEPREGTFGETRAIPGFFLNVPISFDYVTTGYEIGLELDIDNPTFGNVKINYPVSTTIERPSIVDTPGATFEINTGSGFSSTAPSLTGQAVDFGIFGIDLIFGITPGEISNLRFTPSLLNFTFFEDGISLFPTIERDTYRLVGFGGLFGGVNELNLPGFSLQLGFPEGEDKTVEGTVGALQPLSVEVDSTLFGLDIDLAPAITRRLPVLSNILEGVQREFSVLGQDFGFSFTPLKLELAIEISTRQSFEFKPGDITATVSFSTDGVEGDSEPKPLGESFTFTAPDNLEEPIKGQVVYDFFSQLTVDSSLVPEISGTATILDTTLTVANITLVEFGLETDAFSFDTNINLPLGRTFNVPFRFTYDFVIPTNNNSEEPSVIDVPPPIDVPPSIDIPNIINGTPDQDVLVGTDVDDIITGFRGQDTITGGKGSDQFVYTSIVEAGDIISDFQVGVDRVVLTQVIDSFGYQGSDPIADGYVQFGSRGSDSFVQIDPDGVIGSGRSRLFILVENVPVSDLNNANNFVFQSA